MVDPLIRPLPITTHTILSTVVFLLSRRLTNVNTERLLVKPRAKDQSRVEVYEFSIRELILSFHLIVF